MNRPDLLVAGRTPNEVGRQSTCQSQRQRLHNLAFPGEWWGSVDVDTSEASDAGV